MIVKIVPQDPSATTLEFLNKITSSVLLAIIARKERNPRQNANLDLSDHHPVLHQEVRAILAQEDSSVHSVEL